MTKTIEDRIPQSVRQAEAEIAKYAKKGCNRCYGRGLTAWLITGKTRSPIICRCVNKAVKAKVKREIEEKERESEKK